VLKIGEEYLSRWIERDWVAVAAEPLYPTQVKSMPEVSAFVREHGASSIVYVEGAPSIDITEAGRQALPKAPNSEGSAAPQRAAGPRLNKPGSGKD
jgi:hypothetical protein